MEILFPLPGLTPVWWGQGDNVGTVIRQEFGCSCFGSRRQGPPSSPRPSSPTKPPTRATTRPVRSGKGKHPPGWRQATMDRRRRRHRKCHYRILGEDCRSGKIHSSLVFYFNTPPPLITPLVRTGTKTTPYEFDTRSTKRK